MSLRIGARVSPRAEKQEKYSVCYVLKTRNRLQKREDMIVSKGLVKEGGSIMVASISLESLPYNAYFQGLSIIYEPVLLELLD